MEMDQVLRYLVGFTDLLEDIAVASDTFDPLIWKFRD